MQGDQYIDRKTDLPLDFYSTKTFTDNLLGFFKEREEDEEEKKKPFFAYLPFTAPHWPMQAPREVIDRYSGVYDGGPEALRDERLRRLKELGIIAPEVESAPWSGILEETWDKLSPEERKMSARKMEVYAAMVDVMDHNIGRVLEYLEDSGELDNTFIIFMSDNGAEGTLLEAFPVMGTNFGAVIEKHYNNSIENIGNKDSFVWYGARWACASMAPSRGFKSWTTEGGIRCPCIVRYPPFSAGESAKTGSFATVMDILPTVLELAGIQVPVGSFRGRDIVPLRGTSWVSHLESQHLGTTTIHDENLAITGWELFGNRAIRLGQYKAIWLPPPRGAGDWELYNVETDPAEVHDLATEDPELMKLMITHWETYYTETGMFQTPDNFQINSA
jgi:arylsulfatase A-like enzyme